MSNTQEEIVEKIASLTKIPKVEISFPFFSLSSSKYFAQFLFRCPVWPQWKHVPSFPTPPLGFNLELSGLLGPLPFPLALGFLCCFFPFPLVLVSKPS